MKWGEHSNDVQFILQWSPLDSAAKASGGKSAEGQLSKAVGNGGSASSPVASGETTDSPSGNGFSPLTHPTHSPLSPTKPLSLDPGTLPMESGTGVLSSKKRETNVMMRGAHRDAMMNSSSGSETSSPYNGRLLPGKSMSSEESEPHNRKSKDLNLVSPPPYRDPPTPGKLSGVGSSLKELPPYRDPPPPNLNPTSRSHLQRIVSNHSPVLTHSSSNSTCSSVVGTPQNGLSRDSPVLFNGSSINGGSGSLSKESPKFMTPSQNSLSSFTQPGDTTDNQGSWKYKASNLRLSVHSSSSRKSYTY
jgi:Ras association domain-containing protein 7/8